MLQASFEVCVCVCVWGGGGVGGVGGGGSSCCGALAHAVLKVLCVSFLNRQCDLN